MEEPRFADEAKDHGLLAGRAVDEAVVSRVVRELPIVAQEEDLALRDHALHGLGHVLEASDRAAHVGAPPQHLDLCALHLGGTRIAGVMLTMDGEQGVRLLELVAPKVAMMDAGLTWLFDVLVRVQPVMKERPNRRSQRKR